MGTLLQDLRFGWRVALKSPGFTLVAVLTLAIGIAANTAVYGWIDSVLLHPLPGVAGADRVVAVETRTPNGEFIPLSYPDYLDYRDHLKLVSSIGAAQPVAMRLGEPEHAQRVWGELVTGNYFSTLGVRPLLGRTFTREEAGDQAALPVVVLGEALWRGTYLADPGIVGRTVRLNGRPMTVVGVLPAAFHGALPGVKFDLWAPFRMAPALNLMPEWMPRDRGTRSLFGLARLADGVNMEQARAEMASLGREMARRNLNFNRGLEALPMPVWQAHFGAQAALRDPLRVLMAICGLVLLIVCANVANLLLARASAREKEFSVRLALGAWRGRLMRQLLTECLLLAGAAAVAALPLIELLRRSIGWLLPGGNIPIEIEIRDDWRVFAFTALVSLAATLVAALAPAWQTARADLSAALNDGGRGGSAGHASQRLRAALVGCEVALACVALIGAGLFSRSFLLARSTYPGFETRGVGVAHLGLGSAGYSVEERVQFCARLRARLEQRPGITAVAYADTIPMSIAGTSWEDLQIEGYQSGPGENMKLGRDVISPGYLALLGIPLREGRDFTELDTPDQAQAMIVNESFVRRFLAGRQVLGTRVRGWGRWFTVVGVAADSKYSSPSEGAKPYFYVPFRQVYRADLPVSFLVKGAGGLEALRGELTAMDAGVGLSDAMALGDYIGMALVGERIAAGLLAALGLVALLLAGVGLYGVMSYSMARRTREIGIRMAMGAGAADVERMVVGQGLRLTLAGVAVGLVLAAALAPLAASQLYRVSAFDPVVFAGAVLFLAAVGTLAAWLPARRAVRIELSRALRSE
jgi:predicted permease